MGGGERAARAPAAAALRVHCHQALWRDLVYETIFTDLKDVTPLVALTAVEKVGRNRTANKGLKPEPLPGSAGPRRAVWSCPWSGTHSPAAASRPAHKSKGRLLLASRVKEGLVLRFGP